ncbi:unnamed protein product [Euphydryas editha]|uniref:Uncharacterized protein n=1 Tax=Euphydryas editha TaxID=104508 RepID=A0AAU9TLB0_EUPED|nr:unnamed protein product [Euphydryas editha]
MGNVQCCASNRLLEGKTSKKPKNKKKKQKESSEKTNGVGGGNINETVNKVTKVAEDNSDRPTPQAAQAQAQASPPPDDPVKKSQESLNMTQQTDSNSIKSETRNETMAAARERFFGQVYKN